MELELNIQNQVAHLRFSPAGGAMDLEFCQAWLELYEQAATSDQAGVILLWGGAEFFSNGIDLNSIHQRYNPQIQAYQNLKAINAMLKAILDTKDKLVLAALQGAAAAGGVMLALATDLRYARSNVTLNPHYANMGLSGSEYFSLLLPAMVGFGQAQKLLYEAMPVSAKQALSMGLLHDLFDLDVQGFNALITARAEYLASTNLNARLVAKRCLNHRLLKGADEQVKLELEGMKDCCNSPEFERARAAFVTRSGDSPLPLAAIWPSLDRQGKA